MNNALLDQNKVFVPTVHLNGTGYADLFQQLDAVTEALDAALSAMSRATPHGRDYYTHGDAISPSRGDHFGRVRKIEQVWEEINAIKLGVYRQRRAQ